MSILNLQSKNLYFLNVLENRTTNVFPDKDTNQPKTKFTNLTPFRHNKLINLEAINIPLIRSTFINKPITATSFDNNNNRNQHQRT